MKVLVAALFLATGCATAPSPPPVASCGAGGEVVNFPAGLTPGVAGKMPVNVGRGDTCPK